MSKYKEVSWLLVYMLCLLFTAFCNNCFAVQIYAHRGGRGLEPESTLPAYTNALKIGVNYVDMDIVMTRDHVLVVHHNLKLNPNLTKNAQGEWINQQPLIKSLTLKQLEQYNVCSVKAESFYAKLFSHQAKFTSCRIPTLQQVVDLVNTRSHHKVGFQIEIKSNPEHRSWSYSPKILAHALATFIRKKKIRSQTEVQSFDFKCLQAIAKEDPKIHTAYLTDSMTHLKTIPAMVARLGGQLWDPQDIELNQQLVKQAHELGLKVVAWSWAEKTNQVYNESMVRKLIRWHVDGIITDRPDKLRNLLKKLHFKVPPKIRVGSI